MSYTSKGTFLARAFVSEGALPEEGVTVRIYGNEESNGGVDFSLLTDRSGITEIISLPAPSKEYSLSPGARESAFATYNIEASKNGFYTKRIDNIPIFADTLSILPLSMIPNAGITNGTNAPEGSNFSIITENEELD